MDIFRANFQDCKEVQEIIYISNGYLVLFEKESKKMKKILLVKLITNETKKSKSHLVDSVDAVIFHRPAEKKISTIVSGQSLIILLTDSKVKSTKLKARFLTLVLTF